MLCGFVYTGHIMSVSVYILYNVYVYTVFVYKGRVTSMCGYTRVPIHQREE